jgi:hypothetical protein
MKMTTRLHVALGLAFVAAAGCSSGSSVDNKSGGKATNNVPAIAASNDPAARPQKPLMNTREDWKNVPKAEPPRTVEPFVVQNLEGTVKAVDADRRLITVAVGGQEHTLRVMPSALIEDASIRSFPVAGGLSGIQAGSTVLITTSREGDQDVVARIKLRGNAN